MMVSLAQLWLPILLAAVACHLVGFLVWVVLPHHRSDYSPLPDEAAARNLFKGKLSPGQYLMPWSTHKEMNTPEVIAKRTEGPNAFMVVLPNGVPGMGPQQVKNVLFHALVSTFIAYVGCETLASGTEYLKVFQVCGAAGVLAYGFTWGHQAIWFGKPWKIAMKDMADGVAMALITAGIFGWLWPR